MAAVNAFLQVENLTRRVGDRTLFEKISFGIAEGQRVGLIAQNGTGKSTLLNILGGKDSADSGDIVYRRDLRVGYLEQEPHYPMDLSVIEACFWHGNSTTNLIREYEAFMQNAPQVSKNADVRPIGTGPICASNSEHMGELQNLLDRMDHEQAWDYESRAKQILGKLQIHDFNQPLSQLSGGQLKRVALANVLIMEPDFLILDEPTNHLDLTMIEWLEGYLGRSSMTLLMVTHDRYFLDRVCNSILEMDDHTLYPFHGNYSYYLEKRQERIDATNAMIQRANNLYRTELDWMRRMPQARGHKARYREEAFYELEKVAKQHIQEDQVRLEVNSSYIGSKIFEAEYVSKTFHDNDRPKNVILKDFYYNFARYEKMGIVGGNGTGKSTFVKMLLGLVPPDKGRFVVGETVRFGYFSQDGMQFDEQLKVIDVVRRIAEYIDLGGGRHLSAMQFLQHFMFSPQQQQSYVYKLSGGERRRLYLCTVLMQNPNFLVLDEPTNDLDIITLQALEEYLQSFKGCVIVVSHDRYFMDKVVDHLLVFRGDGVVKDFPGNYTQFRASEEANKLQTTDSIVESNKPVVKPRLGEQKRKLTYKEQKEYEQLEAEIALLEKEKSEIETALSCGSVSVEEITTMSKRLPLLNDELDAKELRWLELDELK